MPSLVPAGMHQKVWVAPSVHVAAHQPLAIIFVHVHRNLVDVDPSICVPNASLCV